MDRSVLRRNLAFMELMEVRDMLIMFVNDRGNIVIIPMSMIKV